jgi:hypothetical protein
MIYIEIIEKTKQERHQEWKNLMHSNLNHLDRLNQTNILFIQNKISILENYLTCKDYFFNQ